ncbi:MAG: hypothetical protein KGL02_09100, partial [Acidobacteriota bacterium]|nr:hypothetical protein [Acidobacteriota bacterium]
MQPHRARRVIVFASCFIALIAYASGAAGADQYWIPTWAASPQSAVIVLPAALTRPAGNNSGQAARPPLFPPPPTFENQTVRM